MAKTKPEWSSLHTRIDTLRFRAVCHSFRSSFPLPPKVLSPYLSLKIPSYYPYAAEYGYDGDYDDYFERDVDKYGYYVVTESTVYAFEPLEEIPDTKTWLVRVKELNSGKVRIDCPLTRWGGCFASPCNPYLSKKLPPSLNLLDYRVKEITKGHNFALVRDGSIRHLNNDNYDDIVKVAVSSCIDEIDDEFVVMITDDSDRIWCWRNRDKEWTLLPIDFEFYRLSDVFYYNNFFYVVDVTGRAITVDVKSMNVTELAGPVFHQPEMFYRYRLVNSWNDMLLIVHGYDDYDGDFCDLSFLTELKVYKLDEEKRAWVYALEYLEDRLLFTCDYYSFSVSAKELSGCEGKCVYYQQCEMGGDIFYLEEGGSRRAFSVYSNIFLPAPDWLKHED